MRALPKLLVPNLLKTIIVSLLTLAATIAAGEVMLRLKNSDQNNYIIEMWRYAKELKEVSSDTSLGHIQVPNSEAILQNIHIKINSLGMRGPEPDLSNPSTKNVLLLGSSITLGWGVSENKSVRAELQRGLGENFQVFNGGIGNYNVHRSVQKFKKSWLETVKPDYVIVHYFLNDAEDLPDSTESFLFWHSQLAVTLHYLFNTFFSNSFRLEDLVSHYRRVYDEDSSGFKKMKSGFLELQKLSKEHQFKVIFAIIPDIHNLEQYPFNFIHDKMKTLAEEFNWTYVDFLRDLSRYKGPELWTIPGDPHPNELVHKIMADRLVRTLN